jgi:hypothetical protein
MTPVRLQSARRWGTAWQPRSLPAGRDCRQSRLELGQPGLHERGVEFAGLEGDGVPGQLATHIGRHAGYSRAGELGLFERSPLSGRRLLERGTH